jgi:hypothetical protein
MGLELLFPFIRIPNNPMSSKSDDRGVFMPRDIFVFWQSPHPLSVSGELAGDLADSLPMAYSEDGTPLCFRQSPDDVPDQAFLSFDGTSDPWLDGGILRTSINDVAMQAYFDMSEPLGRCASYVIYEAKGVIIEHPSGGPASRFADAAQYRGYVSKNNQISEYATDCRFALIALAGDTSDRNYETNVEAVRGSEKSKCWPIFYFRNGQVMLMESSEPASIISQRAARHLATFQHWAVIDASGGTRSSQNFDDRAWVSIEPPEDESGDFDFVGDDEEPLTEVERVFGSSSR